MLPSQGNPLTGRDVLVPSEPLSRISCEPALEPTSNDHAVTGVVPAAHAKVTVVSVSTEFGVGLVISGPVAMQEEEAVYW